MITGDRLLELYIMRLGSVGAIFAFVGALYVYLKQDIKQKEDDFGYSNDSTFSYQIVSRKDDKKGDIYELKINKAIDGLTYCIMSGNRCIYDFSKDTCFMDHINNDEGEFLQKLNLPDDNIRGLFFDKKRIIIELLGNNILKYNAWYKFNNTKITAERYDFQKLLDYFWIGVYILIALCVIPFLLYRFLGIEILFCK